MVNFLVSKLFTRVGPRAAFVIRNVEMVQLEPDYPKNYSPHKVKVLETLSLPITIHNPKQFKLMVTLE